jgi:MFS family permease
VWESRVACPRCCCQRSPLQRLADPSLLCTRYLINEFFNGVRQGTYVGIFGLLTQQLGITSGIFFASLLGYGMVTYVNHGWQYIQVRNYRSQWWFR